MQRGDSSGDPDDELADPYLSPGVAHYAAPRLGLSDDQTAAELLERLLAEHGEASREAPAWVDAEDRVADAELYLTAFDWLCAAVVRSHGALWVTRLVILPPPPAWRLPGWLLVELTTLPQVLCERHIALHARKRGPGLMTEGGARTDLKRRLLADGAPGRCPDWVRRDPRLDLGYCPVRFEEAEEPAACIVLRGADRLRTPSRRMRPLHATFYVVHPTERPRRFGDRAPRSKRERFDELKGAPIQISAASRAQLNNRLPTRLPRRRLDDLCASLVEQATLAPDCPPARPSDREPCGAPGWAVIGALPVFSARAFRSENTVALSAIELHPLPGEEQLRSLVELGELAVLAATSWPAAFALHAEELRFTAPASGAPVALNFLAADVVCELAIADGRLVVVAVRGGDGEKLDEAVLGAPAPPRGPEPAWTAAAAAKATSVHGDPLRLLTELRDERSEARTSAVADLIRAAIANGRLTASTAGVSVGVLYCGAVVQLDLQATAEDPRRLYATRVSGGGREALAGSG